MGMQQTGPPSRCGGSVGAAAVGSANIVRSRDVPVVKSNGVFGNVRRFAAAPPEFLVPRRKDEGHPAAPDHAAHDEPGEARPGCQQA